MYNYKYTHLAVMICHNTDTDRQLFTVKLLAQQAELKQYSRQTSNVWFLIKTDY